MFRKLGTIQHLFFSIKFLNSGVRLVLYYIQVSTSAAVDIYLIFVSFQHVNTEGGADPDKPK